METKNQRDYMERQRLSLDFANSWYIDPIGTAGGLALWWKFGLDIDILSFSSSFMHVFVNIEGGFHCSFVHAPNGPSERTACWEDVSNLHPYDSPWIVMGDLNAIAFSYEKSGGNPVQVSSMAPFNHFINRNNLWDLGYKGTPFTWSNRQAAATRIRCRLDRALANTQWRASFPQAIINHERAIGSDHNPICLHLSPPLKRSHIPFRFDERWNNKEQCIAIISNAWDSDDTLHDKLQSCQTDIQRWAQAQNKTRKAREAAIKRRLEEIDNADPDDALSSEEKTLKIELSDIWKSDELLWKQTARLNWAREA
ncbi:hypothetical protein LINGRAHAP2_LOCUS9837 [Linum grandiflorum]